MVRRTLVALAFLSVGCSLVVDPRVHLAPSDAGPNDAGTDAGPLPEDGGPMLPSAPEVSITPDAPLTTDALLAQIDVESVDPLGRTITYEYSWTRDGSDAAISVSRVEPEATSKDEVWVVSVVAVTEDGRRSPPATATVTIGNSPPVLRSIGLSNYRPIVGDSLTALSPCGLEDPDGGTPTLHYEWRIDGELAGGSSSRLMLTSVAAGAEIVLTVYAEDTNGARSEAITVGPALVVSNETRWVQLLPDRAQVRAMIPDPERCRMLFVSRGQLWEHDIPSNRIVQLRPTGTLGDHNIPTVVTEPDGAHAYLVGTTIITSPTPDLFITALDMPQRGAEAWRSLPLAEGSPPLKSDIYGAIYDEGRARFVFITPGAVDMDLWSADLSGDTASFTLGASAVTTAVAVGAWVRVPGTRRVLVLGGADVANDGTSFTPNALIHELDLDDLAMGFRERSEVLPMPLGLPLAWPDPERNRILLGWGAGPALAVRSEVYALDLDTFVSTPLDTSGAPVEAVFGTVLEERHSGDAVIYPGSVFIGRHYELYRFDADTGTFSGLMREGVDVPPAVQHGIGGWFDDDFVFYGGRLSDGSASQTLWRAGVRFGAEFRAFVPVTPAPDAMHGTPGPRFGVQLASNMTELVFFGGRASDEAFADTQSWRWTGTAWSRLALDAATTPPTPRVGAAISAPIGSCGGRFVSIGGNTGGTTNVADVATLTCGGAPCVWATEATSGTPLARSGSGVTTLGSEIVVVGGDGAEDDVSAYDPCTRTWRSLTVAGTPGRELNVNGDLVFGGHRDGGYASDVFRLVRVDADNVSLEPVSVATDGDGLPRERGRYTSAYDPTFQHLYVYGGITPVGGFFPPEMIGDFWVLRVR
jgi:hypothetical protein